jgi:hypothetical protein
MNEQIIFRELTNGTQCLYDTRSCKFFPNGGVNNEFNKDELKNLANAVARKPFRTIIELAEYPVYDGDNGYATHMIAKNYLKLNPDILLKVGEAVKGKVDKKMTRTKKTPRDVWADAPTTETGEKRGRGRPRKNPVETTSTDTVPTVTAETGEKRGRGRPRKNPVEAVQIGEKRGRGRPRKNPVEAVEVGEKRGRGRPRKNPESVVVGEKRGRGRPRKNPVIEPKASTVVGLATVGEKRGRGRPRKNPVEVPQIGEKRGRGRPRKNPVEAIQVSAKRGRGRPRKNPGNEIVINGITYVAKA